MNALASPNTLQIRLRGRGSGFKEGPLQIELDELLHFVVSTDDEKVLPLAVAKTQELVQRVAQEMNFRL